MLITPVPAPSAAVVNDSITRYVYILYIYCCSLLELQLRGVNITTAGRLWLTSVCLTHSVLWWTVS